MNAKAVDRSTLTFSVYVDVFVTNEQNVPLGRVPLRVLSGHKVVATSRTEAVGALTGHTPLPSSHRPLVVPWYKFSPSQGAANPGTSMTYQLEADGTTLGYVKQTLPLVLDAGETGATLPSTIVELNGDAWRIGREGAIPVREIEKAMKEK